MSHFSKVKTRISDLSILRQTLVNLGFSCDNQHKYISDINKNVHYVDLVAIHDTNFLSMGFVYDNDHYTIIADVDLWKTVSSFNFFVEQLNQNYALNMILRQTNTEGFNKIKQDNLRDGSIKLTVQRWR